MQVAKKESKKVCHVISILPLDSSGWQSTCHYFQDLRTPEKSRDLAVLQVIQIYSYLKAFTGFAVAARIACQLTVSNATNKASKADNKNGQTVKSIR